MTEDIWDEAAASTYDETHGAVIDEATLDATIDFLSEYATDGTALELAIGTGRVALPLSARGIDVHGIELSPPMVDQLETKEGADRIPVTIGDMATTTVDAEFGLVYLVYNTITNLLTQAEQVACSGTPPPTSSTAATSSSRWASHRCNASPSATRCWRVISAMAT